MTAVSRAQAVAAAVDLDLLPVPLVVTGTDGVIEAANALATTLLTEQGGTLVGRTLGSLVGTALDTTLDELDRAAPGTTVEREVTLRRRSNRMSLVGRRVDRDSGPLVYWALHHIASQPPVGSRLQQLDDELELERSRLAAIVDGMPAGVLVASAPSGRIVLTNDQAAQMKLTPLTAAGVTDFDQLSGFDEHGRRLEPQDWPLARALVLGESIRGERVRVERADGSSFTVEANANPIRNPQGEIVAAVVVFWDVSERERRERAEREFITNAAHELQTPVASIVSSVEVLLGGAKDVPEDRERFLRHLDRESERLVRVLRSLLVMARTQLGHETVDLSSVRLRPLLDRIALGLQPRRGIEVVVRCPARLTVVSHDELLEQAVANLAANSARHTASGRIVLSAARRPEGVRIEISDTGSGIDPDDVERLFGRFTRGDRRGAEGFGVGLAIVRQTVTALGGTVSLAPRRGGGTVARIVLPETGRVEP